MSKVLIGLGPFRFSISELNYQQVHRSFEYRWEPQMRIGRRPAMQFLGPGEETIDLEGTIYPDTTGGFGQLNSMRRAAMTGAPMPMAAGTGQYFGPWCIAAIRDDHEFIGPDGTPRKVTFTIGLTNYGADGAAFGGVLF